MVLEQFVVSAVIEMSGNGKELSWTTGSSGFEFCNAPIKMREITGHLHEALTDLVETAKKQFPGYEQYRIASHSLTKL